MEQKARAYLKRSIIITNISPDNVASEILNNCKNAIFE